MSEKALSITQKILKRTAQVIAHNPVLVTSTLLLISYMNMPSAEAINKRRLAVICSGVDVKNFPGLPDLMHRFLKNAKFWLNGEAICASIQSVVNAYAALPDMFFYRDLEALCEGARIPSWSFSGIRDTLYTLQKDPLFWLHREAVCNAMREATDAHWHLPAPETDIAIAGFSRVPEFPDTYALCDGASIPDIHVRHTRHMLHHLTQQLDFWLNRRFLCNTLKLMIDAYRIATPEISNSHPGPDLMN